MSWRRVVSAGPGHWAGMAPRAPAHVCTVHMCMSGSAACVVVRAFSGFCKGKLCVRQAVGGQDSVVWCAVSERGAHGLRHSDGPLPGAIKNAVSFPALHRNGHISGSCFGYTCRCCLLCLFSGKKIALGPAVLLLGVLWVCLFTSPEI